MDHTSLVSRVLKTEPTAWKSFRYIQQETFKDWSPEAKTKLKNSIAANNFTQPFYVWLDPSTGEVYCLDGRHRTLILEELITEGVGVPDLLPATFIDCKDKKDAAGLVLTYSSVYAKIRTEGLFDFIELYDIDWSKFSDQVDLPGFDNTRFTGDMDKDFSSRNMELDINQFANEIIMKLSFPKDDYIKVKQKLDKLMISKGLDSAEAVISNLLAIE